MTPDEVITRVIPQQRWRAAAWLAMALVVAAVAAWELQMRRLGLRAGDLDDSRSHWAVERRKVATGEHDGVVIIGSSRILFDTNLDAWEEMSGLRPIQLALPGTNPRPHLKDLAENSDFAGLLVVGVTPDIYFTDWPGIPLFAGLTDFWREESPSSRFGHRVWIELQRRLAFLDDAYRLGTLIDRAVPLPDRPGVRGPIRDVWKLAEVFDDRQTTMWPRLETDEYLRDHARWVWGPFNGEPLVEAADAERIAAESRKHVEMIRARGGEVVFIRAPSAGLYLESERQGQPRARTWDRLLAVTGAYGIHFEDHDTMRDLDVPEWSHLSAASQPKFTRAYVELLMRDVPWLREHVARRAGP
ncbi:MAG: hypothetical protein KF822_07965 [Steroidobacteraceae bacterium]|nr:hypothetical protein [Steroidobacteraceae bacterium]